MEENRNDLPEESCSSDPICESPMNEVPQQSEPLAQEAAPAHTTDNVQGDVPQKDLTEQVYLEEEEKKKTGKVAFFAILSSVLAVCLALLIALLFVGENGIRIFRTLHSERIVYVREDDGTSGLLTPQEAADVIRKSTVTVSIRLQDGRSATGSGFVYDGNGHICTNYHVIQGATDIQVILPDGNAVAADVVGYDAAADLAVLHVQASGLVPVTLGSSSSLLVGDEVLAVGTPLNAMLAGTATFGRVSYTRRLLPVDDDGDGVYEKKLLLIQSDTSVNAGNSGGPMADMYGRVVGVVVRKIESSNDRVFEGVGFAIPIDGAKIILDAIIENGSFTGENPVVEGRSLLGVTGHLGKKGMWYYVDPFTNTVTGSEIEADGYHYMPADGVYVIEVQGANAKNKIRNGDVILAVNGFAVEDTQELIMAVNRYACGESVSVRVWRDGAELTVQVVLNEG